MDWFERLDRWQRVCATLSVIGFLAATAAVYYFFPQDNLKLMRQLTAAECLPIRALPANETNPNALSKEHYALYMQCDELFWYRARHPQSDLTPAEYQDRLKEERQGLIVRSLLYWLVGVAVLFLIAFVLVRAFGPVRRGGNTDSTAE